MKNALLITCHNIYNYGSIFQTYATTRIFEQRGICVEVIDYQRPYTDKEGFRKKILAESRLAHMPILGIFFPYILKFSFEKIENVFDKFLKNNIKLTTRTYFSERQLIEACPQADIYISGSDQIWNSDINGGIEKAYYLSFTPEISKRISFASSFGKSSLNENEKEETRKLLSRYNWITTREDSGNKIIKDLGLESKAILDPTMWMTKDEWEKLSEPISIPPRYILVYQLHKNKNLDKYVYDLQKKYRIPCLRIDLYYHYIVKCGMHRICPSPGQVIYLIKNASYIVTDSFHMTAFSIIFEKQFVSVYSDNSYQDRIENILSWLSLKEQHLQSYEDYNKLFSQIDYEKSRSILKEEREKLNTWLDSELKKLDII